MKLYIIEDNQILLQNLTILLNGENDIEVQGGAICAEDALKELQELEIDIVITDMGLPGMSGVEFIKELKIVKPHIQIIANTICEDNETVFDAIRSGASGYMLKGSTPRELIEALHELYSGGAPMSSKIARKVILEMQSETANEQYLLTPKEKEVLRLIEKGYSYQESAKELSVSRHTINSHIKKIYQKLHAKNKQEALLQARKIGII